MHFKQCKEELQKKNLTSHVKTFLEFPPLNIQTPLKELKSL